MQRTMVGGNIADGLSATDPFIANLNRGPHVPQTVEQSSAKRIEGDILNCHTPRTE